MTSEDSDATPRPVDGRALPGGRRLVVAGKLLLIAAAVWLMLRLFEGVESADLDSLLAQADRGWLLAVAALLAARAAVWGWRWSLAIRRAGGSVPVWIPILAVSAATAVNHVTPGARVLGGFLRARWLSRARGSGLGASFGGVFGTVLFDQLNHQIATGAATMVALVAVLAELGQPGMAVLLLVAMVVAGMVVQVLWHRRRGERGLGVLVRFLARRAAAAGGRMQRLYSHSREAVEVVRQLGGEGVLWRRCLALGGIFVLLNVLAQWAAFVAVGSAPSFLAIFIGVALGSTAGILLGTPGGVGAAEAAMIACYVALGTPRLDATAAVLLYRGLHYAMVLVLGLPAIAFFEMRGGGERPEVVEVEAEG